MVNQTLNELEIASKSVVKDSARKFSRFLAESPQFKAFEDAYQTFQQDTEAQTTYREIMNKQRSLRMMGQGTDLAKELENLKELESRLYDMQTVKQYIEAQENLVSLCQEIGDILNDAAGLNFALATKVGGCCG